MSRFLLVTHIYPPAIDGGSNIIFKLGQYYESVGHQIMFLSSNASSTDDFTHQYIKVNNSGLPVYTAFHRPLKHIFPILGKGPIFKFIPFIKALLTLIKYKPDYIIAGPLPTTIILYAVMIKKLTGAKLITIPCYHPQDQDFQNTLIKKSLNHSDLIVTFTKVEKKLISKFTKCPTIVQPPGIDSNFIISQNKIKFPSQPNILFIANFSAHKRFELLIEAFKLIQPKFPGLTLTALGQKTLYWPKIESLANAKNIKVVFKPTRLEVAESIDSCTLLCLPSIHESFGLVFAESLARGKPVIGADTPQTSEVINKLEGGTTFQADDIQDLADKLTYLISHPQFSQKLGLGGYNFVKRNLTWDKIGYNLWQKILSL